MVLNPEAWQELRISESCFNLMQDFSRDGYMGRPLRDQEILNIIFGNTFHRLNPNWNFRQKRSWSHPNDQPLIAHFAGRAAPWDSRDRRALPIFCRFYQEAFDKMPSALDAAIDALMLTGSNLRRSQFFMPKLGRWNVRHGEAWNPAHAPLVADWLSLLPWNR
jgi:hypothetical protein